MLSVVVNLVCKTRQVCNRFHNCENGKLQGQKTQMVTIWLLYECFVRITLPLKVVLLIKTLSSLSKSWNILSGFFIFFYWEHLFPSSELVGGRYLKGYCQQIGTIICSRKIGLYYGDQPNREKLNLVQIYVGKRVGNKRL